MKPTTLRGSCLLAVLALAGVDMHARADPLNPFPLQVMTPEDKDSLQKAIIASLETGDTSRRFKWNNKDTVSGTSPNRINARWTLRPPAQLDGKLCREVRINLDGLAQEEYVHPFFCKADGQGWQLRSKQ